MRWRWGSEYRYWIGRQRNQQVDKYVILSPLLIFSQLPTPAIDSHFIVLLERKRKKNWKTYTLTAHIATTMTEAESVVLPWYKTDIGPYLGARGRQLLEKYSGLHPDEVEPHAYRIVYLSLILFFSQSRQWLHIASRNDHYQITSAYLVCGRYSESKLGRSTHTPASDNGTFWQQSLTNKLVTRLC